LRTNSDSQTAGKVYLVGAGPGNPDLLTVKAVRTLGMADIVLHDALVSAEVLSLASQRARLTNVGKRYGRKSITQDEINDLLVRFAIAGKVVVPQIWRSHNFWARGRGTRLSPESRN